MRLSIDILMYLGRNTFLSISHRARARHSALRLPAFRPLESGRRSWELAAVRGYKAIYRILNGANQWEIVQSPENPTAQHDVKRLVHGRGPVLPSAVRGHGPHGPFSLGGGDARLLKRPIPLKRHDVQSAPAIQPACALGEGGSEPSRAVENDECYTLRYVVFAVHLRVPVITIRSVQCVPI